MCVTAACMATVAQRTIGLDADMAGFNALSEVIRVKANAIWYDPAIKNYRAAFNKQKEAIHATIVERDIMSA